MDLSILTLFVPACLALNMIPGPNNLMSMHNGQSYGFVSATLAGVGRLMAFSLMIALAAFGLAVVLYTSEVLFALIRVAGACYLFYVAYHLWQRDSNQQEQNWGSNKNVYQLARQEFLLAAGNPKAILIFTSFLPQFIQPGYNFTGQFLMLGCLFLTLELVAVAIYATLGAYLKHWFSKAGVRLLFNRLCAGFIASVGVSFLFEQQKHS